MEISKQIKNLEKNYERMKHIAKSIHKETNGRGNARYFKLIENCKHIKEELRKLKWKEFESR